MLRLVTRHPPLRLLTVKARLDGTARRTPWIAMKFQSRTFKVARFFVRKEIKAQDVGEVDWIPTSSPVGRCGERNKEFSAPSRTGQRFRRSKRDLATGGSSSPSPTAAPFPVSLCSVTLLFHPCDSACASLFFNRRKLRARQSSPR